jgi:hydroxyacylglutathione hydrolase
VGFGLTDPYDCNVYALVTTGGIALVDCGAGMGVPAILEEMRADGLDPQAVRWLLLTHGHADHAGGGAALRRALPQVRAVASPAVAAWMRTGDEDAVSLAAARAAGVYPQDYRLEPFAVEETVRTGDVLHLGDQRLEVIDTPGHADGHLCFLWRRGPMVALFAGDQVFHGGRVLIQRIPDCRLEEYARSMARLGGLGLTHLFPGHLSFVLRDAQAHIDRANRAFARLEIPPNLTA